VQLFFVEFGSMMFLEHRYILCLMLIISPDADRDPSYWILWLLLILRVDFVLPIAQSLSHSLAVCSSQECQFLFCPNHLSLPLSLSLSLLLTGCLCTLGMTKLTTFHLRSHRYYWSWRYYYMTLSIQFYIGTHFSYLLFWKFSYFLVNPT